MERRVEELEQEVEGLESDKQDLKSRLDKSDANSLELKTRNRKLEEENKKMKGTLKMLIPFSLLLSLFLAIVYGGTTASGWQSDLQNSGTK